MFETVRAAESAVRELGRLGVALPPEMVARVDEFATVRAKVDDPPAAAPGPAILAALAAGRDPATDRAVSRALAAEQVLLHRDATAAALEAEASAWTASELRPAVQAAAAAAYDVLVAEPIRAALAVLGAGDLHRHDSTLTLGSDLAVTAAVGQVHAADQAAAVLRRHWNVGRDPWHGSRDVALLLATPPSGAVWRARARVQGVPSPWDLASTGWTLSMPASAEELADRQAAVNEMLAAEERQREAAEKAARTRDLWRV